MSKTVKKPRVSVDFRRTENVPASDSTFWNIATPPLFDFLLEKDRSIDEIVAWGKAKELTGTMIRQMLAWLSIQGQVHYDITGKIWRLGSERRV